MSKFIPDDFPLKTAVDRRLCHEFVAGLPIIDCHNHLDPRRLLGVIKLNAFATQVLCRRMRDFSLLLELK